MKLQKSNSFKSPPKEWIEHKLNNLQETLTKNSKTSALALKELFGTIELEPIIGGYRIVNGKKI